MFILVLRQLVKYYRIPLDGSTIEYRKAIRIIKKIVFFFKEYSIRFFDYKTKMGVERCFGRVGEGVGGRNFAVRAM